jgi:hypothetical protein
MKAIDNNFNELWTPAADRDDGQPCYSMLGSPGYKISLAVCNVSAMPSKQAFITALPLTI